MPFAMRLTILVGLAVGFVMVWGLAAFVGGGWPNVRRNLLVAVLGVGVLAAVFGGYTLLTTWIDPLIVSGASFALAVIGWMWVTRRERRQPAEVREARRQALQERRPLQIILLAVVLGYVMVAMYVASAVLQR